MIRRENQKGDLSFFILLLFIIGIVVLAFLGNKSFFPKIINQSLSQQVLGAHISPNHPEWQHYQDLNHRIQFDYPPGILISIQNNPNPQLILKATLNSSIRDFYQVWQIQNLNGLSLKYFSNADRISFRGSVSSLKQIAYGDHLGYEYQETNNLSRYLFFRLSSNQILVIWDFSDYQDNPQTQIASYQILESLQF